jgi:hypothetical protein
LAPSGELPFAPVFAQVSAFHADTCASRECSFSIN